MIRIPALVGRKVYLICGVSGSGKTWVCEQIKDKFNYIPHDKHYHDIYQELALQALKNEKPIITECPFAERVIRCNMEEMGFEVIPIFVIENADVVAMRYFAREGKEIRKAAYTRASTIINRAIEWKAMYGTATDVLLHLKRL